MRVSVFYLVLLTCSMQMLLASSGNGQSIEEIKVTLGMRRGETLESLFKNIEKQSGLLFAFNYEKVNKYSNIRLAKATRTIKETLDIVLQETPFIYRQVKNSVVIFQEGEEPDWEKETFLLNESKETEILLRITGKVTDTEGTPMPGVNVIVEGTTRGTSTDADGKFAIDAEDNEVLVFSFIGFKTFKTEVNARVVIDVTLEDEVESLQEVVVNAGYWNAKEREKTGSISKVTADVIGKQPVTNPLGALQGRMPGVFIQQTTGIPGGDFNIQIRGKNSLRDDGNAPLYVVDGVPFSTEKVGSNNNTAGIFNNGGAISQNNGVSPLTSLNPADIESIEVLKDADATAIYGSRGANGVVLITTKKGKSGKTKFDLNFYTGAGKARRMELLNTQQYLAMRRKAFANEGLIPSADPGDDGSAAKNFRAYAPDLMVWDTTRYTDWQKELTGNTAETISIQGSLSGGGDNTQFLFSTGYRKESTVFPGDFSYQKGSIHLSVNHSSASNKFFFNVNVSGTMDKNNQVSLDFTNKAIGLPPNAPALYDENGELNWANSTWGVNGNPLSALVRSYDGRVSNVVSNVIIGYEAPEGLRFKTSFGLNSINSKELTLNPSTYFDPSLNFNSSKSAVIASSGSTLSWVIEPQVTWEKKIAKGQLSMFLGSTFQEQQYNKKSDQYYGFPSNSLLHNLPSATYITPFEFINSLYRYTAVFGRVNYNWKTKYILNLTARRDGSSRFGPGKQFANFGAVGTAWIFTNEAFVRNNLSFLSFGKLRASYGVTGNDQIGNYQYLDTYNSTSSGNTAQYQGVTVLNPSRLYNPDFAWEENRKLEVAMEMGFMNDRMLLNVSYYRNRSSNQLVNYTLPLTTGFNGILANLGATVQNTGYEIELTTENLHSTVNWTTSINFTVPQNKLIEFPNIESSSYANTYMVGKSIYIKKVYESTGTDPQTELFTFKDYNEDGVISPIDDNKKVVFVGQNFFGGINNSIDYNGWRLDIFFQFVKQTGYNYWYSAGTQGIKSNQAVFILKKDRWQMPGDQSKYQRFATEYSSKAFNASLLYQSSDGAISDASFIRLKNVSLSYQLPSKWTKNAKCRFYFQGQNLLTITRYEGYDPEKQTMRLAPLRMFTLGVQFTL